MAVPGRAAERSKPAWQHLGRLAVHDLQERVQDPLVRVGLELQVVRDVEVSLPLDLEALVVVPGGLPFQPVDEASDLMRRHGRDDIVFSHDGEV